jgi:FemAB-related protein (PEP-CTERM system-associated)
MPPSNLTITVAQLAAEHLDEARRRSWVAAPDRLAADRDPRWLAVLQRGLKHRPMIIEARRDGELVGLLPLALVESFLFGRYLVSLPYLNWAGVMSDSRDVAHALVDRAVALADELDVRHLELRHEVEFPHPALTQRMDTKANMRLKLSGTADDVWKGVRSVVRTQIRKGQAQGFTVEWGGLNLLEDFYAVFAQNMRDLGTPVYGRALFRSILAEFPSEAELCVVRLGQRPIAAALAVHGKGITEVPSASVHRAFRSTAANSFMYWELIQRALARGQQVFDFGRSTIDSGTFAFKKKWGAEPEPAVWQYYRRHGEVSDIRPDGGKYDRLIAIWKRIPVPVTKIIGPSIVRGIP